MDWLYPLSGFFVGSIVGLTGMGGGSLMTPLLILFFGMHPLTAVGTDLLYAAVTKTAGTTIHGKKGNVEWRLGAVLGVLVSLCSVGAGALGVAVLFFLYPRLATVRVIGSDLAHAVPLTLVAGLGHWIIGGVDWSIVGALLFGSLPGIYLGSHLSTRISDRYLLPALASMLVLVGLRLIAS